MNRILFISLIAAMVLGVAVGALVHDYASPEMATSIAEHIKLLSDVFLRMIKMIIAPLVISTLAVGIAHLGGGSSLGRIGVRTMAWFLTASVISLGLGLVVVSILKPGIGFPTELAADAGGVSAGAFSLKEFLGHVFPTSIIDAMARNEVLQIVVFSVFLGAALSALGDAAKMVTDLLEQVAVVMLRITGYVMTFAPVAVFAALAATICTKGLGVLVDYGRLLGSFYAALGVLWVFLAIAGFAVLGPRLFGLLSAIRTPALLAFSTASSEAAYPRLLEQLERFGIANRIVSFVLPLGYSFNLDGSMMYCTFAVMFIAQAMGLDLTLGQQLLMLFMLLITSKGIAGVPRASLVVISATLPTFGMPTEAVALVIAVDAFMDMGRTATNVIGNSIACAVIAKWEGLLHDPSKDPPMVAETLDTHQDTPAL